MREPDNRGEKTLYKYSPIPEAIDAASKTKKERNDCTVRAFAIVLNTSYEMAHKHMSLRCGRTPGRGVVSRRVLQPSLKKTKHRVGPYSKDNRITLKKFCETHPDGRYYVCVARHAIAVVDGVVYDFKDAPRRFVTWALRVYLD